LSGAGSTGQVNTKTYGDNNQTSSIPIPSRGLTFNLSGAGSTGQVNTKTSVVQII
jgi:hypothetical protein